TGVVRTARGGAEGRARGGPGGGAGRVAPRRGARRGHRALRIAEQRARARHDPRCAGPPRRRTARAQDRRGPRGGALGRPRRGRAAGGGGRVFRARARAWGLRERARRRPSLIDATTTYGLAPGPARGRGRFPVESAFCLHGWEVPARASPTPPPGRGGTG